MFGRYLNLLCLVYLLLQLTLTQGQGEGTLMLCPPNELAKPGINLEVDCSLFRLSWMATEFSIEYYGLEASCSNSTSGNIYIDQRQRLADSFQVNVPSSATPSPGQECTYFGCIHEDFFSDVYYFHPVTCTGSVRPSAWVVPTTATSIPLPTTATTIIPLPTFPSKLITATTSQYSISAPVTTTAAIIPVRFPPEITASGTVGVTSDTATTRETPKADDKSVSILVVLAPIIVAAFALVLLLIISVAGYHCCATKHQRSNYRKRHMDYSLPEAETQLDLDIDYIQYFCSPLSRKATYSLSEASIHTILEHLRVDDGSVEKSVTNRTHNLYGQYIDVPPDLNRSGSSLECDYIIGMSTRQCSNCGVWGCTSSAEQMQPSTLGDEVLGREVLCTAINCDYTETRLESELKDSGYCFQLESNGGDGSTGSGHSGAPQDKLKDQGSASEPELFCADGVKADSGFCSIKDNPPIEEIQ